MPLIEVISDFGKKFHQYADDTQIYITVNNENSLQTLVDLVACTQSIYELFGALARQVRGMHVQH